MGFGFAEAHCILPCLLLFTFLERGLHGFFHQVF
jgi:hypothetical protein